MSRNILIVSPWFLCTSSPSSIDVHRWDPSSLLFTPLPPYLLHSCHSPFLLSSPPPLLICFPHLWARFFLSNVCLALLLSCFFLCRHSPMKHTHWHLFTLGSTLLITQCLALKEWLKAILMNLSLFVSFSFVNCSTLPPSPPFPAVWLTMAVVTHSAVWPACHLGQCKPVERCGPN